MAHLKLTIEEQVATITLFNPPQNRLALTIGAEIEHVLDQVASSDARAVLIRAEGPDFSFGGDIVPWPDLREPELRAAFEHFLQAFNRFERLPLPTVAAVHGLCFGGGLELAVRADVIFAGRTARFGHPEASIAIVTLLGGVYRVAERVGRAKAIEWALTSEQVPAEVAAAHGLVNRVVDDDKLLAEAHAFALKIAKGATKAHAAHKALLRIWATGGTAAADEAMMDIALPLFATDDVRTNLPKAVELYKAGKPRTPFPFTGK